MTVNLVSGAFMAGPLTLFTFACLSRCHIRQGAAVSGGNNVRASGVPHPVQHPVGEGPGRHPRHQPSPPYRGGSLFQLETSHIW